MEIKEAKELFKVLADESRLTIVKALSKTEEICACKLLAMVNCTQPTLSHHMKVLADSGLVKARKDWKWIHYSLDKKKLYKLMSFFGGGNFSA